jgi:hypothetical protein
MAGWIIAFVIGALVGWVVAHSVVATECEKLGSFYVGDKTFKCVKVVAHAGERQGDSA